MRAPCGVPECGRPCHARGLCKRHYQQTWRWGGGIGVSYLQDRRDSAPGGLCSCPEPDPSPIGQCSHCGQLVLSHCWCPACRPVLALVQ